MAKQPNMKVNVTADNSDLSRKMRESKGAVKDFEKVSSDAIGAFGSALGVNVDKVNQLSNALKGLGAKMQESGNDGAKAFGKLLSNVSGLSAAMAGVGIAGVVASFKALNEQAETFKNTLEGASLELMTTAYIETYRQVLNDFNRETAKAVAEAEQSWKIAWNTFTTNLSYVITSGSIKAGDSVLTGLLKIFQGGDKDAAAAATQAATEAMRLTQRMYEIQVQMNNKTVEWARMEREIAEYKRIAYDKTVATATQQEALAKASQLIEQRYKEEARYRKQLADLQAQYNDLASSSLEDIQKANQLRIDEENTIARMNNALRELSERDATIKLNAAKEAEAMRQAAAAAEALAASKASLQDWRIEADLEVKEPEITDEIEVSATLNVENPEALQGLKAVADLEVNAPDMTDPVKIPAVLEVDTAAASVAAMEVAAQYAGPADIRSFLPKEVEALTQTGLAIPITPELDMSQVVDITNELQSVITSAFDTIGVSIGELIGDLATGGDAWSNFANTAMSAFGDMAVSIGRMAISTGVATLGIEAALKSLNGYAAIAAGVALVALGSAVKAGLSNIAAGNYSSSANVATAGGYGTNTMLGADFETREMKVEVTGTLRASGNELLTVIENENTRKKHTT